VGEAEAKCAALAEDNTKLRRDVALKTNAGGLAAAYNDAAQQGKVAALIATDAKRREGHALELLEAARRRDAASRHSARAAWAHLSLSAWEFDAAAAAKASAFVFAAMTASAAAPHRQADGSGADASGHSPPRATVCSTTSRRCGGAGLYGFFTQGRPT
jgi:hypothetical protein